MPEKRTLTIGVTINIGNYESLRLEVSDCVQTEEEAAELAAYLNRVLDGYAQNDATTRASIEKYRARVLEKHGPATPVSSSSEPLGELFDPISDAGRVMKRKEQKIPESEPVAETPKVHKPVVAEPAQAAEGPVTYTCEKCGAAVSKVQRDVSHLFMGKTLCKACMK
ncbi:MAG TPA: hypothetical protein O0X23_04375 [Methanocorpusculum sp.]|nr:hypothetical protein [Methanocorpusculum sp.]